MNKIVCREDLKQITDRTTQIVAENLLENLLTQFHRDSIADFGKIIVLSSPQEFDDYLALGLANPISGGSFEFADTVHIWSDGHVETFYFGCIVISNDKAIDLLINRKNLTGEQIKRFTSEFAHLEYTIPIERQGYI